jgi:hypothetical protein
MTNNKRPRPGAERRAAFKARLAQRFPRRHSEPRITTVGRRDFSLIALGADDHNRLVTINEAPRLEHAHVIGATGSGKSTFMLNCILQDMARGRGVAVLDPHGSHPDSLLNNVLRFLDHYAFPLSKVHIIAPNIPDLVVGFNPLAPLPGTDPVVIADAMVAAFERAWGDENTLEKPLTRRLLRSVFTALAECRMTIPDAADLLDYQDTRGVRLDVISRLQNEAVKTQLENIERLARQPRSFIDFQNQVLGPVNRLEEFIANPTMRLMFSMSREQSADKTIDLLDVMEKGHILLVDLQHGPLVSEPNTDLLGKILLRYLFLLMAHRKNLEPYFVYVDECHRFMTDDVESLLAQARKYRIGVSLAHQYLAQLGKPQDKIYEAVRNSTEIKTIFRINSQHEAEELAHDSIPFDLEIPLEKSIYPRVVGQTLVRLYGESESDTVGEGESVANINAVAESSGRSYMQSWADTLGRSTGISRGTSAGSTTGRGSALGTSSAQGQNESTGYNYDPSTGTFLTGPTVSSASIGASDSSSLANIASESFQSAENLARFEGTSEAETRASTSGGGIADNYATSTSQARAAGRNTMRQRSRGRSWTDTYASIFKDLPGSFHSAENVKYMMGQRLKALPVGRAVVRFRGRSTFLNIPPPRRPPLKPSQR